MIQFSSRLSGTFAIVAVVCAGFIAQSANAATIRGGDPGKWGDPIFGTGATISWSIMGAGLATDNGQLAVDPDALLPTGYFGRIVSAFDEWAAVANLTFNIATDPGVGWKDSGADAVDIRIGFRPNDGPGGNYGFGYYPLASNGAGAGDIFIDSAEPWGLSDGAGVLDLKWIMVHEIGHALGLEHSSFGTAMYPYYGSSWDAPQADDIAGIQQIYGAPTPVPLPTGLPMLASGLILLGFWRRRYA